MRVIVTPADSWYDAYTCTFGHCLITARAVKAGTNKTGSNLSVYNTSYPHEEKSSYAESLICTRRSGLVEGW